MGDGPISDRALAALRGAAALTKAVHVVRAQLRDGDRIVLEVGLGPSADAELAALSGAAPAVRLIPPCAFHRAVAAAHRMRRQGEQLALRGVPAGVEPSIHLGVPADGRALPGAMVRLARDGTWWHLAPVAVTGDVCRRALLAAPDTLDAVAIHVDDDVEACVLHVATPAGDRVASRRALDQLGTAVALVGIEDLGDRLDAGIPDRLAPVPAPRRPH